MPQPHGTPGAGRPCRPACALLGAVLAAYGVVVLRSGSGEPLAGQGEGAAPAEAGPAQEAAVEAEAAGFWGAALEGGPHAVPRDYHAPLPPGQRRPPGWAAAGCGIGPPPARPALPPPCAALASRYAALCANASGGPPRAPTWSWRLSRCTKTVSWAVGRPVTLVATAYADGRPSCGPSAGRWDVLDARVDGPRSVETVTTSAPRPWLQLVSFRPVEAGSYTVHLRQHLRNWEGGWSFVRHQEGYRMRVIHGKRVKTPQSVGGRGQLPQIGPDECPLIRCNNPKANWHCMVHSTVQFEVGDGGCPQRVRPSCNKVWPRVPGAWYGRWVRQCAGGDSCDAHPVRTRPLDAARGRIEDLGLLRSAGACGPTAPGHPEARAARSRVFSDSGGWVWEPDVCIPRLFNPEQAWRCLNRSGVITVGDSVVATNGHLLHIWMDMTTPKAIEVSQRGQRHDEGYGVVHRHERLLGGGGNASMFFWQLARQRYEHLADLSAKGVAPLITGRAAGAPRARVAVLSLGMHEAVGGNVDPAALREVLRSGISGLGVPLLWAPDPSPAVRLSCTKKNPERLRLAVAAMDTALSRQPTAGQPRVAFLPSFEMGRALWWDVPIADISGTHVFCSLVGLSMWQQLLDLTCAD
eukprot:TRINITY_DN14660_c0_g1_i1.p1 TRINITY_DN14660_c0_g1~~TRINITY_DN14660_c0_g1_i1.p1  ORF type:complete len:652 (+),score=125.54 TRINITY_DN14660_c0_g1_i1:50-1957(+)